MEEQTRTIEGMDVTTSKLPAMRSFAIMPRVLKIIAPGVAAIQGGKDGLSDLDLSELMPQLSESLNAIAGDTRLVYDLLASTYVVRDGKRIELNSEAKINAAFDGNLKGLLLTLKFSLEVTFNDFFPEKTASAEEATGASQ